MSLTLLDRASAPVRLLALPLLLLAASAGAQQPAGAISGVVRDSAGKPVEAVEVIVAPRSHFTRTDGTGAFHLTGIRSGRATLAFRRFGFQPETVTTNVTAGATAQIAVSLHPFAQDLPGMLVTEREIRAREALQGFYHRRENGGGYFITRADIEKRNPFQLSDMLRTMPGAMLEPVRGSGRAVLRFARSTMPGHDCPPQYYVDGVMAIGLNIDDLEPGDIEGIEVYDGVSRLPPQFNDSQIGTSMCGVVVVWTRVPGT